MLWILCHKCLLEMRILMLSITTEKLIHVCTHVMYSVYDVYIRG